MSMLLPKAALVVVLVPFKMQQIELIDQAARLSRA